VTQSKRFAEENLNRKIKSRLLNTGSLRVILIRRNGANWKDEQGAENKRCRVVSKSDEYNIRRRCIMITFTTDGLMGDYASNAVSKFKPLAQESELTGKSFGHSTLPVTLIALADATVPRTMCNLARINPFVSRYNK